MKLKSKMLSDQGTKEVICYAEYSNSYQASEASNSIWDYRADSHANSYWTGPFPGWLWISILKVSWALVHSNFSSSVTYESPWAQWYFLKKFIFQDKFCSIFEHPEGQEILHLLGIWVFGGVPRVQQRCNHELPVGLQRALGHEDVDGGPREPGGQSPVTWAAYTRDWVTVTSASQHNTYRWKRSWVMKTVVWRESWKSLSYKDRALSRLSRFCFKSGLCSF